MSVAPRLPIHVPQVVHPSPGRWLSRTNPVTHLQKHFDNASSNPLWFLINRLSRPNKRLVLSHVLARARIASAEYLAWRPVVLSTNFSQALNAIFARRGLAAHQALPQADYIA